MDEPIRKAGNPVFSPALADALRDKADAFPELDDEPIPSTERLVAFVNGLDKEAFSCFLYLTERFALIGRDEVIEQLMARSALAGEC